MYTVDVALSDVDRGVYESLSIKAACHPSETEEYFATRILAYCLEYKEGISFSKGLSEPDVPAISVRDLTGALTAWIEIGSPDAARLHKASKASPRVAVYTHRDPLHLLRQIAGERIHRAEEIELYAIDRDLLGELKSRLERRMSFQLSFTESHLYLTLGGESLDGAVVRHSLVSAG